MRLPIGYDSFQEIVEKKLDFVDKTLFIKAVLDDDVTQAAVITRPRRFGKTLNLSMLQYFLAKKVYGKETQGLFDKLDISRCGDQYMQHQGKYPVVFISFKDIKSVDYDSAFKNLSKLMSRLYHEHIYLLKSDHISLYQKKAFELILEEKSDEMSVKDALLNLMRYLYLHCNVRVWLLIDGYDVPIQSGYIHGYYAEIMEFMRGLLGAVLKTNPYLERALVTAVLHMVKEGLFSGLNNLRVYSILDSKYSEYFGFTESEVDEILKKSDLSSKSEEIKEWYNGYKIGETIIYNPWSIVNCVDEKGTLKPYWGNTSDDQLIKDLLRQSSVIFKEKFESLLSGDVIEGFIDENIEFQHLNNDPSVAWSLLLMNGYLKPVSIQQTYQGTVCQLAIPNKEVQNLYSQIMEQ